MFQVNLILFTKALKLKNKFRWFNFNVCKPTNTRKNTQNYMITHTILIETLTRCHLINFSLFVYVVENGCLYLTKRKLCCARA